MSSVKEVNFLQLPDSQIALSQRLIATTNPIARLHGVPGALGLGWIGMLRAYLSFQFCLVQEQIGHWGLINLKKILAKTKNSGKV